ncbi:MAG: PQQ-dependent sugar dehydrogenase [Spirosomataceae bacterium]
MKKVLAFVFQFIFFAHLSTFSQVSGFQDTSFASGFGSVNGIAFDNQGKCYAWEKNGKVWVRLSNGDWKVLVDISDEVNTQTDCGLKGFALDPNFLVNGYVYLLYDVDRYHLLNYGSTSYNPNLNDYSNASIGRITRYTVNLSTFVVLASSRFVLLGKDQYDGFPIVSDTHNTGALLFGTDGTLLASCGESTHYTVDNGSNPNTYYQQAIYDGILKLDDPTTPTVNENDNIGAWRAQIVNSLSGKIIRINPATGDGVPSNPFYDSNNPRAAKSRVWALGLRNAFRMTLKPNTGSHNSADGNPGEIYVADVGSSYKEEVDIITQGGQNFGWPRFEGMEEGSSPIVYYPDNRNEFTTVLNHKRPAMDYRYGGSRAYKGGQIVSTSSFNPSFDIEGTCIIGGVFYTGTNFPAEYQGTYLFGNFDNSGNSTTSNWIHSFKFDSENELQQVLPIDYFAPGVTSMAINPMNGYLYYTAYVGSIREIKYDTGNQPPVIKLTNEVYWSADSNVNFTFDASGSTDPEGGVLSYSWNFGDGSSLQTGSSVSHTFTTSSTLPTSFNVAVTVTDALGLSVTKSVKIYLNNTPPQILSTSVDHIGIFANKVTTYVQLRATVSDNESANTELSYLWESELHHNTHYHPDPVSTSSVSSFSMTPVPCDGNTYFYRVKLTITDTQGLSSTYVKDIYPSCSNDLENPTVPSNLQVIAKSETTISLAWNKATDNSGILQYELVNIGIDTSYTSDTSLTISGLIQETSYEFKIRAIDSSGNYSNYSNIFSVTTNAVHPLVTADEYIYHESVSTKWSSQYATSRIDLANGDNYKIDTKSIKITTPVMSDEVTFDYTSYPLFTEDFPGGISLWVYNSGMSAIPIQLRSIPNLVSIGDSVQVSLSANSWSEVIVPWSMLNSPTRIAQLKIKVLGSQDEALFLDEIKLVHCSDMTTVKSGNWEDATIWSCGRIPIVTDTVTINTGHIVTVLSGVSTTVRLLNLLGILNFQSSSELKISTY